MNNTKLLSIDPSIAEIGYALFEDTNLEKWGTIKTDKGDEIIERLRYILSQLNKFEGIDNVVMESPPHFTYQRSTKFGKTLNMKSMNKLHLSIGTIIAFFSIKKVNIEMIDVMEWKGRQRKKDTQEEVRLIHKVFVNEHEADAIMLGEYFNSISKLNRMADNSSQ